MIHIKAFEFNEQELLTLTKCRIDFYKNAWYIANNDLKNCTKEDSINVLSKVTEKLNTNFDKLIITLYTLKYT